MYSGIIGHYLKDYKVPIKWFFGDVEDDLFKKRLAITIRVLKAIKKMTQSKVALVGGIAPGFDDLYDDERKLIRLFDGIRINRLHEYSELRDLAIKFSETEVAKRMNKIAGEAKGIHVKAKARLEVNARFSLAYEKFIDEYKYDGVAISCWPKFQEDFQYSVCSVVAELNDNGTVAACEGDLTSAISMLLLQYIAEDNTMLMDLSAFDTADDTVLMWHCGPASKRYCRDSGYSLGLNYSGAAHEEDSKEIDGIGVTRDMIFDPEKITIARLTGESDKMFLAEGEFISNFKKSIHGSRGWVGNLKLNRRSISALDFVNTILVQRFQHHFPIVAGDYSKEVMEAMAWLNLKQVKAVPYEDYMQNPLE
jgi:L-fucose isomerase-like protein